MKRRANVRNGWKADISCPLLAGLKPAVTWL